MRRRCKVAQARRFGRLARGKSRFPGTPFRLRRRMRKLIVCAVIGVFALALAAIAMAETVQNYEQTFSAKKPSASTGTSFSTDSIDEANTTKNKQPLRTTQFDITFPKGTV